MSHRNPLSALLLSASDVNKYFRGKHPRIELSSLRQPMRCPDYRPHGEYKFT
jgi:hypothetical protein